MSREFDIIIYLLDRDSTYFLLKSSHHSLASRNELHDGPRLTSPDFGICLHVKIVLTLDSALQESSGNQKQCAATYNGLLKMIELRGGLDMLPRPIAYQVSRSVNNYPTFEACF